ncbi:MAG: 4-hydroxythreonine-4-phosphate dehydrogenase PdxA [Planctomycetaceae bacterium]|nr:4-hydroxythreonine-4-phosphate dehydrogenase PdxA [Planctomycetaceae bacterium]
MPLPRIALTLGDVAGIGPEVVVRAWQERELHTWCRPVVVGHPEIVRRAVRLLGSKFEVRPISRIDEHEPTRDTIVCWNPTGDQAADVCPGANDGRAGQAACEYLSAATAAALEGRVDAMTTAPLSKAALHLAGLHYPGHTEILAELCGVRAYAMMLYLSSVNQAAGVGGGPQGGTEPASNTQSSDNRGVDDQPSKSEILNLKSQILPHALGVVHVTLHTSIRSVPDLLSMAGILEKIQLIDRFLKQVGCAKPRVGVCALNPHAGEQGLFGDEERTLIAPAVQSAAQQGIDARGPFPADTLLKRATEGEFDGVVAMYHDQGHIALKLIGFNRAVNVTLGLPIVRTSPSHGTAFDIAWQGKANGAGMIEAVRVAARLSFGAPATNPNSPLSERMPETTSRGLPGIPHPRT